MKFKKPNMETLLCLLAGVVVLVASSKHVHSSLLDAFSKPPHWRRASDLLSHVLVAYGTFFLGLALLSYALSLRGAGLVSAIVNRSRRTATELRHAVSSSIRGGLASRQDVSWLLAAFAVGLVIRGYFLAQPMRHAESYTFLNFVNRGFLFLYYYPCANNHVLHTLLVKLSTLIWGARPVAIRLPAFLFGIASVPLTFCLCRKLMHGKSGVLASVAMAVTPYLVFYSVNARGNSLLVFLTLALAFMGMHVAENPSLPGWALISLIAALGMLTMPSMLFSIAGVYLWLAFLLFFNRKNLGAMLRESIIPCSIMTFAFTVVLYVPSIVTSGGVKSIISNRSMEKRSLPWDDFLHHVYPHARKVIAYFLRDVSQPVLLIGMILLAAGIFGAARRRDWALLLLLPSMVLGTAAVFLFMHSIPPARIWLYLIPFVFVLADSGLTYLGEKLGPRGQSFLPLLLIVLGSFYAVSVMSRNVVKTGPSSKAPIVAKYLKPLLTGSFPEAPIVAKYLKPLLSSSDIVHSKPPVAGPMSFYLWYYGMPEAKKANAAGVGKEFFVVKKSRHTINLLTEKPVIKLLDFGDAALYQLLPPEEIRMEKTMNRSRKGIGPR